MSTHVVQQEWANLGLWVCGTLLVLIAGDVLARSMMRRRRIRRDLERAAYRGAQRALALERRAAEIRCEIHRERETEGEIGPILIPPPLYGRPEIEAALAEFERLDVGIPLPPTVIRPTTPWPGWPMRS